jgi:hypothetical protein
MAEMLSLDPDLVAFILAHELIQNRWVDSKHKVTPEGERLLSGRLDRDSNLTLQYAFRDSLFGSWIPRVSKDLPDISPIEGGGWKVSGFPSQPGRRRGHQAICPASERKGRPGEQVGGAERVAYLSAGQGKCSR